MKRKVTVVGGAGNVGATVARQIAEKELADVVIIDIAESKAAGVGQPTPQATGVTATPATASAVPEVQPVKVG